MRNHSCASLLAVVACVILADAAMAQNRGRYQPAVPPISPYQNYFRARTVADIPNYYSFVRPEVQTRDFVRRQYSFNQVQNRRVGAIERQFLLGGGESNISLRPTMTGVGQASTAAGFMNYQQFYSFQLPRIRR